MRCLVGTHKGFVYEVILASGACRVRLVQENHFSRVRAVAYAPGDSSLFATASADGTLRLWDAGTYEVRESLWGAAGRCSPASFGAFTLVNMLWQVRGIDLPPISSPCSGIFLPHGQLTNRLSALPLQQRPDAVPLVPSSQVISKGQCQVSTTGEPSCLCFTGEVMFSGWEDGCLRAHDAENGKLLWTLDNCHRGGVVSLAVSNNRKFIVTGQLPNRISVEPIARPALQSLKASAKPL